MAIMRTAALAAALVLSGSALALDNVSEGLMGSLVKAKDFKAARQSSFDPSGGNADGRQDKPLQAGETRDMAVIDGAGAIVHIWVTIASGDVLHLKNMVLRMYWDGEETPSVETPIGDFFGLGHGQYYQYDCMPIQIGTSHGLNCFWRMPFSDGARVTISNEAAVPCGAFYYYVDYQKYDSLPEDTLRFHAQYRQAYPCPVGKNYTFFEAEGRGHYVGCNLSIHNNADGWWGEGDDMIYIDGEAFPSLYGTGSEDYFCGAWCYGDAFSDLYLGCPLRGPHQQNGLWNVYRYHIEDPVPFTKSIRVTIEHGHANNRGDDFSSVAYWYQTEPHAPFAALPEPEGRMPKTIKSYAEPGAVEFEDFVPDFGDGEVIRQALGRYDDSWSGSAHTWFRPTEAKGYTMTLEVPEEMAGPRRIKLWYTEAPDYGTVVFLLNGKEVAEWDGFNEQGVKRNLIEFDAAPLAGANTFEVRITGKNERSAGYYAGIDCIVSAPSH